MTNQIIPYVLESPRIYIPDEILNLEAGPILDALVSSLVLSQGTYVINRPKRFPHIIQHVIQTPDGRLVLPDNHSTDIGAAWPVIEKLTDDKSEKWFTFAMRRCTGWNDPAWGYEVTFGVPYQHGNKDKSAWATTAPLAISRAALLVTQSTRHR